MGYRRKTPAVLLCKSIVISIQWFQIPHIITFSTIYNLAVLFSGARVSQNLSLVPQLVHRVTLIFMIIAGFFVICFIPKLTMLVWESVKTDFWQTLTPSKLGCYRFLYRFYIVNNIINPYLYGFLDKKFRTECRKMLCRKT